MIYNRKWTHIINTLIHRQENKISWRFLVLAVVYIFSLQTPLFTQIAAAAAIDCTSGPLGHGAEDQYSEWDIVLYSKVAAACCPPIGAGLATSNSTTAGGAAGSTNSANQTEVFNYLVKQGLSQVQALGIVGNIVQESKFNPTATNGNAFGIVQWLGPRVATLKSKAAYDTIATQEAFIWEELTNGYRGVLTSLSQATTVQQATEIITRHYEIPCVADEACFQKEISVRTNFAIQAASELGVDINSAAASAINPNLATGANSTPAGAIPLSAISSSCVTALGATPGASATGLIATVLSFAWEDGRRGSNQKPAYTAAIQGRYQGGNNGNDCGAFVSAAMVVSGYEPNYPGTNSAGQYAWLKSNWDPVLDKSQLQPGDIAYKVGHVYLWVGDVPGFSGTIAEAAYGSNVAPTAVSLSSNTYDDPSQYEFFRKRGASVAF